MMTGLLRLALLALHLPSTSPLQLLCSRRVARSAPRAHALMAQGDDLWEGRYAVSRRRARKGDDPCLLCCRSAELRKRIENSASTAAQLGAAEEVLHNRNAVWVLIFNLGRNDEGVYTLQGRTSTASSYVLAFEQTDEVPHRPSESCEEWDSHEPRQLQAQRFAALLQAEGFDLPEPVEWQSDQIRTFCDAGQFELGIVPTGALLTPPAHNEYDEEAYGRLHGVHEAATTAEQRM
ncbi:MAG: hypothetical protein SGPRY_000338, partial [Prymnesium sp.]